MLMHKRNLGLMG